MVTRYHWELRLKVSDVDAVRGEKLRVSYAQTSAIFGLLTPLKFNSSLPLKAATFQGRTVKLREGTVMMIFPFFPVPGGIVISLMWLRTLKSMVTKKIGMLSCYINFTHVMAIHKFREVSRTPYPKKMKLYAILAYITIPLLVGRGAVFHWKVQGSRWLCLDPLPALYLDPELQSFPPLKMGCGFPKETPLLWGKKLLMKTIGFPWCLAGY